MKTIASILAALAVACGGTDIDLCNDPNGCTVTPSHPPINMGVSPVEPNEPKVQHADAGKDVQYADAPYLVPTCEVEDKSTGVLEDLFCDVVTPKSPAVIWVYWPANNPQPNPGIPCDVQAVLPVEGDQCYDPTTARYGAVKYVLNVN